MQEPTTEQRLIILENRVSELERERGIQADRDIALLARIDDFIDDLRRVERVQLKAFETLTAGQKSTEAALATIVDALQDHKANIETLGGRVNGLEDGQRVLQAGQEQIIALLTGKSPHND